MRHVYCRALFALLLIVSLPTAGVLAQDDRAEDLRRQIQLLQTQLGRLENEPAGRRRVSDVGAPREAERNRGVMVVRLYDVSDLFAVAPNYEAQSLWQTAGAPAPVFPQLPEGAKAGLRASGGMGGGMFSAPDAPASLPDRDKFVLAQHSEAGAGRDVSAESLVDTITASIDPTSWDEVGGPGSINCVGSSLLISATPNAHQQVESLLNLFRERWKSLRTISVRASWLWLSDAEFTELIMSDALDDSESGFGLIAPDAWKRLLTAATQEGAAPGYRAVLTCYNSQTASVVAGAQATTVIGVDPVAFGKEAPADDPPGKKPAAARVPAIAYRPLLSQLATGAALEVTPSATRNGRIVTLDLHSEVILGDPRQPDLAERKDAGDEPGQVAAAIDRPLRSKQVLATTLRIPVNRIALVGGFTFEAPPDDARPHLALFVKVAVQELRDDPDEQLKPAAGAKQDEAAERASAVEEK